MSVLILDPSNATCNALVQLLSDLGLRSFKSHSPLEACQLYLDHRSTLRMIVCDLDNSQTSQLKNIIRTNPSPGILPIVGTTSNIWKIAGRTAGILPKPFGKEQLRRALLQSWKGETSNRNYLLWVGTSDKDVDFQRASLALSTTQTPFTKLIAVENISEWKKIIPLHSSRIGGVVVHEQALAAKMDSLLSFYRSSPIGLVTPWICLSRRPAYVRKLWNIADTFLDSVSELAWSQVLRQMADQLAHFWEVRRLSQNIRTESQIRKPAVRMQAAKELLQMQPWGAIANSLAGELYLSQGNKSRGKMHLWRAIQINPGLSQPYFHLFSTLTEDSEEKSKLIETATSYCPNVLKTAMRTAKTE